MHVARAELVDVKRILSDETERMPCTFFSLDASERMKYNAFRGRHSDLASVVRRLDEEERKEREKEVKEMFLGLIGSHLNQSGIELTSCYAGYGLDKKVFVETPYYALFRDNKPFDAAVRVVYWFSTQDETLSCTSNLDYRTGGVMVGSPERQMVYDLLRKVSEGEQDGMKIPIISFKGDFIYFASTEFALTLMKSIKYLFERVGPEAMQELNVLYEEYMNQRSCGEFSDTTVKQRVFREAYERKLETELLKARLIEQKLIRVK